MNHHGAISFTLCYEMNDSFENCQTCKQGDKMSCNNRSVLYQPPIMFHLARRLFVALLANQNP